MIFHATTISNGEFQIHLRNRPVEGWQGHPTRNVDELRGNYLTSTGSWRGAMFSIDTDDAKELISLLQEYIRFKEGKE